MRKLAIVLSLLLLLESTVAFAESWTCPSCGNEATGNFCNLCGAPTTSDTWICINCKSEATGNFCSNCASPRPTGSANPEQTSSSNDSTADSEAQDTIVHSAIVKDYVGRSLSLCGYTSWGGERRDRYAETTVLLVMVSPDGAYIDPEDEEALEEYKVIAQYPVANTQFDVTTDLNGNYENLGYSEIILIVSKNGNPDDDSLVLQNVRPSPDKSIQYVRDYSGRTLEDVGYAAWNGNRYDEYGPDGLVQIVAFDEQGTRIDVSSDDCIYYYVVDQDVKPDTEMTFLYSKDSSGELECTGQSIDLIQLTVSYSEIGLMIIESLAAEEEELRAAGNLLELYAGTYEIGKDIPVGNYELSTLSSSCDVYLYTSQEAFENSDGDWMYLYGSSDREYLYLTEGMYLKIEDGVAKAKRSDLITSESEFSLFSGVYRVGTDLIPGSYELRPINSKEACDVYLYQNENAFDEEDRDWMYLYGKDDVEYLVLQEGMILEINSGASTVIRK